MNGETKNKLQSKGQMGLMEIHTSQLLWDENKWWAGQNSCDE